MIIRFLFLSSIFNIACQTFSRFKRRNGPSLRKFSNDNIKLLCMHSIFNNFFRRLIVYTPLILCKSKIRYFYVLGIEASTFLFLRKQAISPLWLHIIKFIFLLVISLSFREIRRQVIIVMQIFCIVVLDFDLTGCSISISLMQFWYWGAVIISCKNFELVILLPCLHYCVAFH